jgi:hypothetical protein
VLDVRVLPRSGKAGPDLGYPRVLVGGVCFPYGHGVLVIAGGGVLLLDPFGPRLEGLTSREQQ